MVVFRIGKGNDCGELCDSKQLNETFLGLPDFTKGEPVQVLLRKGLINRWCGLLFGEKQNLMLGGTIALDKGVVVLFRDNTHETLHFSSCCIYDFVCGHITLVLLPVVRKVF